MSDELVDLENEIKSQLNRLNSLEREYLNDKGTTRIVQQQLDLSAVEVEEELKRINEEIMEIRKHLVSVKKITINAIKRLKHTNKVEQFNKLKKEIEDDTYAFRVTKRNVHQLIEDGFKL